VTVPPELTEYLDELVRRLAAVTELHAVYLFGSAAQGAYEHGSSDVDVIAVTARSASRAEKEALAAAAESLPCPARKLELVVYALGALDRHELNVNTGELVHFSPDDDPAFWFVLDRSIAEQHAIPLLGPAWAEVFPPVAREDVLAALDEAVAFDGWDEANLRLASARAQIWRDTGRWVSKREAAARA
jgi:predicted nucleotidyltransferase